MRQHSYFGVTHCENWKVEIFCIFEMKHATGMETCTQPYKDLLFVYLQPSVNKNS